MARNIQGIVVKAMQYLTDIKYTAQWIVGLLLFELILNFVIVTFVSCKIPLCYCSAKFD